MTTLIITRGLPGSGKTTRAREWVAEDPEHRVRVNRDDLREMAHDGTHIKGGKGNDGTERAILKARDALVSTLLKRGLDVVVDDTNLPTRTVRDLRKLALLAGAGFEVWDMTDVTVEACIMRNSSRPFSVGEDIIRDLYNRFIKGKPYPLPIPDDLFVTNGAEPEPYMAQGFQPEIRELSGVKMAPIVNSAYWATEDGRIYSDHTGRFRKLGRSGTTRRTQVHGRFGERLVSKDVHVLTCEAWHGLRPPGMVASHLDGNPDNNHQSNLAWETQSQNHARRYEHGTEDRGLKNSRAAVTLEDIIKIRSLRAEENLSHEAIAKLIGVSRVTVTRILNGSRYAGVGYHAVAVDLDGTVALMGSRPPFDETRVHEDRPNAPVIAVVQAMHEAGYKIIFVSGRTDACREATEEWLDGHIGISYEGLYMRKAGDMRKDSIVKTEIFNEHIRHNYNMVCVLDDRKQVVDAWRAMGLTVLAVAEGDF